MAGQTFDGQQMKASGLIAGSGLTGATAQYKFVKMSADNTVVLCSGVNDVPIGVLQEVPPATGDPVDVCTVGQTMVQAGASLSAGNIIATNASGQAQVAVSGQIAAGQVLNVSGATSAGNLITAYVNLAAPSIKA